MLLPKLISGELKMQGDNAEFREGDVMSTATLTSLAMLKVNIDQGKDYLEYLRPFVLQVLLAHNPDPVTNRVVSQHIRDQFGLEIPKQTVEIVLKRLSKRRSLERKDGVYRIIGNLPDPQIAAKRSEAERHIEAVLCGLREFSQGTIKPILNSEDAVDAIKAFLAEFDITCLRAYLQGTAIPQLEGIHKTDIVLVSEYVQHVQRTDPERFDSFLILVQGHMLANALLCPDLQNVPKTYHNVTFYFDTPLLVQRLGLEGESKQAATRELIIILRQLGGKVVAFSHSLEELQGVLRGAAAYVGSPNGLGPIVSEARMRGTTKSDLLLVAESVDGKLGEADIEVEDTPRYIETFQIDEVVFENVLDDEISYHNPRAREYDINSVRSVYAIRGSKRAPSVEKARAIFVTSNDSFAKAAWKYGKQHESSRDVSCVITAFSLANMAWLKAPMGAPSIPHTQVLAIAYAALEPSRKLWGKCITEIDKLRGQGKITEHDHQVLRSSPLVSAELMHLTLGKDDALTEETVIQVLERVTNEIKKEESEKLTVEQTAHQETQDSLNSQMALNQKIRSSLYWQRRRWASVLAWIASGIIAIVLVFGLFAGFKLRPTDQIFDWGIAGGSIIIALLTLANLLFGSTVKDLHNWVEKRISTWLFKHAAKSIGIDLREFEVTD